MARHSAKSVSKPRHRAAGWTRVRRTPEARHSLAGCKKGSHTYGPEQPIGGGIVRLICESCDAVSIDLRQATDPVTEVPDLGRRAWLAEPEQEPPTWGVRRGR